MTTSDLQLALELADIADLISIERFRALDLRVETKPDRTPVTDADRAVETAIRNRLGLVRPEDSIIGEEYENLAGVTDREWIIDPIDGTANFLRGVPVWASLIALKVDGNITVGVVSAPAMGRRWWAEIGSQAKTRDLDGSLRDLKVSAVRSLAEASISYNSLQQWDLAGLSQPLVELSRKVWRTRAYGDFWSYMLLAEGALDAVAEHDLKIYDIAALVPIVTQAGGRFSDLAGDLTASTSSVLASNGLIHDEFANHFESSQN
jgi:histidinol-phosphatase